MNPNKRKALALVLSGLMTVMAVSMAQATTASPTQAAPAYTEVTLMKGSITQNVIATGSLRFEGEISLKLPEALTLEGIDVKAGEAVVKGQTLARYDVEALKASLEEARDALTVQDEAIVQLLAQQDSDQSIKTAVKGVVKQLNLNAGQMVQQTLKGQPSAILSANGLMQVMIKPTAPLVLGQDVRVKVGTQVQAGSVARLMDDGNALISFPDTRAMIDEVVQVMLSGAAIGEGKSQVSLPYLLYTQIDGVVESVSVKVNSSVTRNSVIYLVQNAAPSEEYQKALTDREELRQNVLLLEGLAANPVFVSPKDGVIAEVTAQEGAAMQKGAELLRLYADRVFVLDVAVDELDILSVKAGQWGMAALDAITDAQLPVQVKGISLLGNSSGGITSYTVTLSIQEDERLLSGMNGTATLTVGEVQDTVLVPLGALMSDRNGNYVLLKDESAAAGSAGAQGTKTYVEVGLSDADYAAVLEGLSEGDIVLMQSSAALSTQETRLAQPGFGTMMNPDRQFNPGGGQRP